MSSGTRMDGCGGRPARDHRVRARVGVLVSALAVCACMPFGDSAGPTSLSGRVVTIYGSERKTELTQLSEALARFSADTGIRVEVTGNDVFEAEIDRRVREGNVPDIALFPQPAKLRQHAGALVTLPPDLGASLRENFDEAAWQPHVFIDGAPKAVPVKSDLKSLVWYSPPRFEQLGYEVPATHEDFVALIERAAAEGNTPLCLGLESGVASGWPFTDWVEDYVLRLKGPEYYDRWVAHEIPFDDPGVVEVAQWVVDLWSRPNVVFGGLRRAATREVYVAGLPVVDGRCLMYRQANFYAAYWPTGTPLGDDGQVNAFYLPAAGGSPGARPTLSGGNFAAAFHDRPEVIEVMKHLASTDFADDRAPYSGVLSPNGNVDASRYPTKLEQSFAKILKDGCPVRFDGSDLMPQEVGAGAFWRAAIDILEGRADVRTAFRAVEASWPASGPIPPRPPAKPCP